MASIARQQARDSDAGSEAHARGRASRSGRLLLRMPAKLHDELSRLAERESISLNQLIVRTLSESLAGSDGAADLERPAGREPRLIKLALLANLVVVGLAAAVAVILLIVAWRTGL
jgi:hypothetical protein